MAGVALHVELDDVVAESLKRSCEAVGPLWAGEEMQRGGALVASEPGKRGVDTLGAPFGLAGRQREGKLEAFVAVVVVVVVESRHPVRVGGGLGLWPGPLDRVLEPVVEDGGGV